MTERADDIVEAQRSRGPVRVTDFDHELWGQTTRVLITRNWSGSSAPPGRQAEARVLWNDEALSVRFNYRQVEPPVVAESPRADVKTIGLWERDVCEVFVAPDPMKPETYYEFEASPTGEWLDLKILWTPNARDTDWDYRSGMKTAARIDGNDVTILMSIPWSAFELAPRAGDRWLVNFFRCAGVEPGRGYVTWRPTLTAEPTFHVPQAFGEMVFKA